MHTRYNDFFKSTSTLLNNHKLSIRTIAPSSPSKLTQGFNCNTYFLVISKGIVNFDLKIFPYLENSTNAFSISTCINIFSPSLNPNP